MYLRLGMGLAIMMEEQEQEALVIMITMPAGMVLVPVVFTTLVGAVVGQAQALVVDLFIPPVLPW